MQRGEGGKGLLRGGGGNRVLKREDHVSHCRGLLLEDAAMLNVAAGRKPDAQASGKAPTIRRRGEGE